MPIHGYPGNVITANPTAPTVSSASGVWTTEQQLINQSAGNWPMAATQVSLSARFNSADSAYLSRTPASAGNRKTWTWSGWVKRSTLASAAVHSFFGACDATAGNTNWLGFVNDSLAFIVADGNSGNVITSAVYRDVSAWYHIVMVYDSTQATASNRQKIYVNGVQVTVFSASTYVSQNLDGFINNNVQHGVGARIRPSGTANLFFPGYLAEVNFIDGLALDPSYFGFNDSNTGAWTPKQYTGAYGTNGFYLPFNYDGINFSTDFLVIAGGGGGCYAGGGAGGYRTSAGTSGGGGSAESSLTLSTGTSYTVTVGGGGSGVSNNGRGNSGSNSVFSTITSAGGGGGGGSEDVTPTGGDGGSGGGGGFNSSSVNVNISGGSGTANQGYGGGFGTYSGTPVAGGGGGGAGGAGGNRVPSSGNATEGGAGGAGVASTITGSSVTRAGGGGGGVRGVNPGAGGSGGGGAGGESANGSNGSTNLGGGGGGRGVGFTGGNGGSGVVIIKIPDTRTATFSSGVTSSLSTAVSGFKIYTVTATSTTSETVTFT